MANPEHLKMLEQGVEAWNEWRMMNPEVVPDLESASLQGVSLTGFHLSNSILTRADLTDANLNSAYLIGSDCFAANFQGAKAQGADLSEAVLDATDLTCSDLSGSRLASTNFRNTRFDETNLTQAILMETLFSNVDMSRVKGIDSCIHRGPSIIDIRTILKSGGLPASLLQACGYPSSLIKQLDRFLVNFKYSTCFISYSNNDDEFVSKLYGDLTHEDVVCRRYKEDSHGSLWKFIDNAINDSDRMILVCSKNSLESRPVMREINRALRKTDSPKQQGLDVEVLIPITIDDYVYSEWTNEFAADVRELTIIDFQDWSDPKSYKTKFEELIKELRAGTLD
jgi:hypothetical protein